MIMNVHLVINKVNISYLCNIIAFRVFSYYVKLSIYVENERKFMIYSMYLSLCKSELLCISKCLFTFYFCKRGKVYKQCELFQSLKVVN